MSSNECQNCLKLNVVINEQKSKMSLIEVRLKDLVKAYKKVCVERDNLLAISSASVLPLNDSTEQQKRITSLEANIAEMAAICGGYESQKISDKKLIQELTQKYEQIVTELAKSRSIHQKTSEESVKPEKKLKSRGVQTDLSIEWTDEQKEESEDVVSDPQTFGRDVETQTDFPLDLDIFNGSNRKKGELAVVLPTVSEPQQQIDSDIEEDVLAVSRNPSQSSDNYPVFESNDIEVHQNNDNKALAQNPSGVSLFYANELARKEIDLAETRLQAREYECALRELKWKYNTEKYRLQSRINELEKTFSQMTSYQPMNQLNVTYIRNVLLKLLNTKDKQQKQFMINAILTALESKDRKPK